MRFKNNMKTRSKKPLGRVFLILLPAALLLVWAAVPVFCYAGDAMERRAGNPVAAGDGESERVYLYFTEPNGRFLTGEIRVIDNTGDAGMFSRRIVDALIEGPSGGAASSLIPVLPQGTGVLGVYVDDTGTVYVDLDAVNHYPGGVRSELHAVYAIVNSLVVNIDGVDRVKILRNGDEAETFAGHIDISHPLNAYMMLVR